MADQQDRRTIIKSLAAAGTAAVLPAGLTACAPRAKDAQVIVIGAGLSGLNASLLLQQQGFDVVTLEASSRIGGRVYTLDDQPHQPDAGGSEFSLKSYGRIVGMIEQLGLEIIPWRGDGMDFAFHVNDQIVSMQDWPAAEVNQVQGPVRNMPPIAFSSMFMPRPSPLAGLDSWLDGTAAEYDRPFGQFLRDAGAGPETLRLIGSRANADNLDDISTLWLMRSAKFAEVSGGTGSLRNLKGGMSRLTDGMAGLLSRPVELNTPVMGIRSSKAGAQVQDASGRIWSADHVICTLPLPVLRKVVIESELPELQVEALAQVPYDNHIEVFFDITEPFWEEDGLAPAMWSDGPLGLVLKLSDDTPNGYLWLAIAGKASAGLRSMPENEIMQTVARELERVRPSTAGRLRPMKVHNWSTHPWSQGHVAYRAPGQITRFGSVLGQPCDRLHFAGEHTAEVASGMEGAMESGERAAMEIIASAL